jgi:hypothetical protein
LPRWVKAYAELHRRLSTFASGRAKQAQAAAPLFGAIGFARRWLRRSRPRAAGTRTVDAE